MWTTANQGEHVWQARSTIDRLLERNRVNLGLKEAAQRIGFQLVEKSLWSFILANAGKAFASEEVETKVAGPDTVFQLLRH